MLIWQTHDSVGAHGHEDALYAPTVPLTMRFARGTVEDSLTAHASADRPTLTLAASIVTHSTDEDKAELADGKDPAAVALGRRGSARNRASGFDVGARGSPPRRAAESQLRPRRTLPCHALLAS